MSDQLRAQLKRQEREILFPYKDTKQIWTIGVGHNMEVDPDMMMHFTQFQQSGITHNESDALLDSDIQTHTDAVNSTFPWVKNLDPARFDALVNLTFNMGLDKLLTFNHFLMYLEDGEWTKAKNRLLYGSDNAGGNPTPYYSEVHGRAMEIANQIEGGEYV